MFDAFQTYSDNNSSRDGSCDSVLTIVFEHVDQDLSMFLHKYPSPGLPEHLIKVILMKSPILLTVDRNHYYYCYTYSECFSEKREKDFYIKISILPDDTLSLL